MLQFFFKGGRDRKGRIQDFAVLFGLLLFSTVLILGLLPRQGDSASSLNTFFMNIMMVVPVIIAVYFIIISFRRKISNSVSHVSTSIRTKIMLALLFVAIVPTLPITIISNNIVNTAISELFTLDTQTILQEAVHLSADSKELYFSSLERERQWFYRTLRRGMIDLNTSDTNNYIAQTMADRGIIYECYRFERIGSKKNIVPVYLNKDGVKFRKDLRWFIGFTSAQSSMKMYRMTSSDQTLIMTMARRDDYIAVFYRIIPEDFFSTRQAIEKAQARYEQKAFFIPFIQNAIGVFLLILSIVVILISVGLSFFLSRNITRPLYELVDASRLIAKGDFTVHLTRKASDEISLLYGSFNAMVSQLDESRRAMMHMQKLEAWKEVGSKLMHEIKNPLTPIRLSAERIRRKYFENSESLDAVVKTGTDTIIEEVDALQHILQEFSRYTRLPKLTPVLQNVNEILQNCVDFFHGHEKIDFKLFLDDSLVDLKIDRILFRQVLINIIKNAIEAMDYIGEIVISSESDGSNAIIRIRDNGPGIPHNDLSRLFEPTFSRKQDGTGLGLAIVEKIVLEHGGRIKCRSVVGNGAEFIIKLPINIQESR
ncbi:MAG: ATP-binding protein [Spirochaetes bacterium]|jgi:two-component system nitrogen regulation sensor histidine kinase NtrY|nr:ATP-binding protein [Spirochaetota bacterium]